MNPIYQQNRNISIQSGIFAFLFKFFFGIFTHFVDFCILFENERIDWKYRLRCESLFFLLYLKFLSKQSRNFFTEMYFIHHFDRGDSMWYEINKRQTEQ